MPRNKGDGDTVAQGLLDQLGLNESGERFLSGVYSLSEVSMDLIDAIFEQAANCTPEVAIWVKISSSDWVDNLQTLRHDSRVELITDSNSLRAGVVAILNNGIHVQVSQENPKGVADFSVRSPEELITDSIARWKRVYLMKSS